MVGLITEQEMSNEVEFKKIREEFFRKRLEAEKAAYAYFCTCEIGDEREKASEIYERIRTATRFDA